MFLMALLVALWIVVLIVGLVVYGCTILFRRLRRRDSLLLPITESDRQFDRILREEYLNRAPPPPAMLEPGEHWINHGIHLETPRLFIRWDIKRDTLLRLLEASHSNQADKRLHISAVILPGNMQAQLSFKFDSFWKDELTALDIVLAAAGGVKESFAAHRSYLQRLLGPPTCEDEVSCEWNFHRVTVCHALHVPPHSYEYEWDSIHIYRKTKPEIAGSK